MTSDNCNWDGLTSADALNSLLDISRNYLHQSNTFLLDGHTGELKSHSRYFTKTYVGFILLCICLLLIGSVDVDNRISYTLVGWAFFLFLCVTLTYALQQYERRKTKGYERKRLSEFVTYLSNFELSVLDYSTIVEPMIEDMWGQQCLRDGNVVNVPKVLLVKGDCIVIRPGQLVPCCCSTEDGETLIPGTRWKQDVVVDDDGLANGPKSIKAIVTETVVEQHLLGCLENSYKTTLFDKQLEIIKNVVITRLVPIYSVFALIASIVRYIYADQQSLFGTRFVFSIVPLIVLPCLCPFLPIILFFIHMWNNVVISKEFGAGNYSYVPKDLLSVFGSLTGVCFVDKKGLLSPMNPSLDKIVVFNDSEKEDEIVPEIMDLSSELLTDGSWRLYFDDISWHSMLPNIMPIGMNIALNSCINTEKYYSFLDCLSCVSMNVPRTIVTASKRCMCQLPQLLGLNAESVSQFLEVSPSFVGFYKRQPGEAPVPGLTKHRTPLEMAVCSLHTDSRSLHSHLFCQGTANLVLEACSHVWNGKTVRPLNARLIRTVKEIYHRNSMTGYCLLLSYRPTTHTISLLLQSKYVEVSLSRVQKSSSMADMARSHSYDDVMREEEFSTKTLHSADEVIDNLFTDHVMSGMVFMQYEALPLSVQLVDKLENNCIRFIYFSRENELRSRIFAEKLGLEAGWNCHISLAEEENEDELTDKNIFIESVEKCRAKWESFIAHGERLRKKFLSKSELLFSLNESETRISPLRRRSSTTPDKVGPMPNKAQLPTGVKAVRPHLEEVDNVPLLVGLFTDCSAEVNAQMVEIMRDYGEVVLSIGSTLNMSNIDVFRKSDISVCVVPLKETNCYVREDSTIKPVVANQLASHLMSLCTDFMLSHEQLLSISDIVTACRHRLADVKNAILFYFLLSCNLSLMLFLSTLLFLPLIFTNSQIILSIFLQYPLLLIGVLWKPFHPNDIIIKIAPKYNSIVSKRQVLSWIYSFSVTFLPTTVFLISVFFLALFRNSTLLCSFSDVVCSFDDGIAHNLTTDEIRHLLGFHMIIYSVVISSSWVHPLTAVWHRNSFTSLPWLMSSISSIVIQVLFSYFAGVSLLRIFSLISLVYLIVWSAIVFSINELYKIKTIRLFKRIQRRTKLAFGTKLGMNSPY